MNAGPNIITAKLFRLPTRSRGVSQVLEGGGQVIQLRHAASALVYCPAVSYHEAAIAEDARARKV